MKTFVRCLTLGLLGCLMALPAAAEPFAKKFRLGFSAGVFNGQDYIRSNSANQLLETDERFGLERQFVDPRNDSAALGRLDMNPALLGTFTAQYGLSEMFLLEASVGYHRGDVGDVEIQAQFDGVLTTNQVPFEFRFTRIPAGEITRIPIQLTTLARFRQRARLQPFIGAGIGYAVIGFEPSDELNELSVRMDGSIGGQTRLSPAFPGPESLEPPEASSFRDLQGATVDARDSFEAHLVGGAEWTLRPKWSLLVDFRYTVSSRSFSLGFNGGKELGISVPNFVDFLVPGVDRLFGAVQIRDGGLLDGGAIVIQPLPSAPADTNCAINPTSCRPVFVFGEPDGQLDPGMYYVQGGSFDYDGLSYQVGFRYTF